MGTVLEEGDVVILKCVNCGNELGAEIEAIEEIGTIFNIEPCQVCYTKQYRTGYNEGSDNITQGY